MDQDAEGRDVLRVTSDGVTVEKGFEAEEFPVPAMKFVVASSRDESVTVRIEDDIPSEFPMDGVGFHPDYDSEQWTAYKDHRVEFTYDLDPGDSLVTVYGIRVGSMEEVQPFLTEPTIEEVIPVADELEGGPEDAEADDERLMADIVSEDSSQLVRDFLAGRTDTLPGLDDEMEPEQATESPEDEPITPAAPGEGDRASADVEADADPAETNAAPAETEPAGGANTADDQPTADDDLDLDMPEDTDPATDESTDDLDGLSMGDEDAESLLGDVGTDDVDELDEPEPAAEEPPGASEDDIADAIDLGLDDADDMVVAESDVEPEASDASLDLDDSDLDEALGTDEPEPADVEIDEVGAPDLGETSDEPEPEPEPAEPVDTEDAEEEPSAAPEADEAVAGGEDIDFDDVAAGVGADSLSDDADEETEIGTAAEEESVGGESMDEEPAVEEPAEADPGIEEPAADEPAVGEPMDTEPAAEEPAAAEPAAGTSSADDASFDQPDADEPAATEPTTEEPMTEETTTATATGTEEESATADETPTGSVVETLVTEIEAGEVDDSDLATLRDALGVEATGSGEASGSLEARIEHLDSEIAELSAYTGALETFLDENGGGQELVDRLDSNVERLDSEIDDVRQQASEHEEQLAGVEDDVADVERSVEDLESSVERVESSLDSVRGTAQSLEDSMATIESELQSVSDRLDAIDEVAEDVSAMDDRIADIEEWRDQLGEMFK